MQSTAVPEFAPVVPDIPESFAVTAQVAATDTSAVAPGLFSSVMCFTLGDQHAYAIIFLHERVVNLMDVGSGRVVGWPFAESVSVPQLLVVGVGVSNAITGERVVTTSQNLAHFDPPIRWEIDAGVFVSMLRFT